MNNDLHYIMRSINKSNEEIISLKERLDKIFESVNKKIYPRENSYNALFRNENYLRCIFNDISELSAFLHIMKGRLTTFKKEFDENEYQNLQTIFFKIMFLKASIQDLEEFYFNDDTNE